MRRNKILKLSRKDAMTAAVLGVVAGVISSLVERIDAVITGGNATPMGFVNTYTWILVSAALFGPFGAILTTEVQAFLGLVTGANPLSWLWPFINFIFAVVVGFVSAGISKFNPHVGIGRKVVLMSVTCAILDIPLTYLVVVMVLGLPFIFYLTALPVYLALQLVPSTVIAYFVLKAILSSGLLQTR